MPKPPGLLMIGLLVAGCDRDQAPAPTLDRQALLDPKACEGCHPDAYREWSGSMHAYAADDPVFVAMNRRGQRESGGALGNFCVRCHAPVALAEGLTTNGLNLSEVPQAYKGVTCFFCHSVASVEGTHSNPLKLADDLVMRGPIRDPVSTRAHASAYSPLLDSTQGASATACGACHDIVNPKGAHVERTFVEWQETLIAKPPRGLTCAGCHMSGRDAVASSATTTKRRVHSHAFPAVDLALTPWPESETQRVMVQKELDVTLQGAICVSERTATFTVSLENVAAGHKWPSGATPDRRAWVEVVAYAGQDIVYSSGVVPDGRRVESLNDPDLWLIRDCLFDESGEEVRKFWDASRTVSNQLPGIVTMDPLDPASQTHLRRTYPGAGGLARDVDRITMRVRLRPIGDEILDELIASGDLDPAVADRMPTFDLGSTKLEWTREKATLERDERNQDIYCVASSSRFRPAIKQAVTHARCVP
jgi:hypothetical protein